jgi:NADP-dependent 3-hydroxy acid dehydrogenase YdfG
MSNPQPVVLITGASTGFGRLIALEAFGVSAETEFKTHFS